MKPNVSIDQLPMQGEAQPANKPLFGGATPSQIKRRRRLAEALMNQATDSSPVGHWTQALARGLQGGLAGWETAKADKEEKGYRQRLAQALMGDQSPEALMRASVEYEAPELMDAAKFNYGRDRDAVQDRQWQQGFDAENSRSDRSFGMQRDQFDWQRNRPIEIGGNLVDPNSYEPVYESPPEAPKPTDDMREYGAYSEQEKAAGREPMPFFDYQTAVKRAGSSSVNVNNGENEYGKARGKYFGETANTLDTEERGAVNSLNSLSALEQQMTDPNFNSGFMAGDIMTLQKAAVALGIGDPSAVTSKETFNSLSSKAALDSMGGSLGSGFSNADRDFVTGQVANLGNTPQGNTAIIGIHKRLAQRKIEIARMARQYESQNGRLDNGFMGQLSQWAEQNPLFPEAAGMGGGGKGQPGLSDLEAEMRRRGKLPQ